LLERGVYEAVQLCRIGLRQTGTEKTVSSSSKLHRAGTHASALALIDSKPKELGQWAAHKGNWR
jgi:hypothetical protein